MSGLESFNLENVLRESRALVRAGRFAEAVPMLMALVELEPRHAEARNFLAVAALSDGDLAGARMHLTAVLDTAPDDELTLNHLAQLQQMEGDLSSASQTYRKLLSIQPALYASRLSWARLLERTEGLDAALPHYFRALRDAHRGGRWLSSGSTAPGILPEVERAAALVTTHRRALCDRIISSMVERFGVDDMRRVSGFVAIQLGDARYASADERQRPSSFPFPGLPQSPYLDVRAIPEIAELQAQTAAILAELKGVLGRDSGHQSVFSDKTLADAFLRGARGPAVWDGFYFYRHGSLNQENAERCPQTMAAIDRLPLARVRGHGPEVLFSCLGPGTHLLPHHGVTNARVVGHLPLIIPEDCALSVAGIEHRWREGEVVVFDDTYSHEAWNRSAQTRVVMIFDMWHPDLSEVERIAVQELQEGLGDFGADAGRLDHR